MQLIVAVGKSAIRQKRAQRPFPCMATAPTQVSITIQSSLLLLLSLITYPHAAGPELAPLPAGNAAD